MLNSISLFFLSFLGMGEWWHLPPPENNFTDFMVLSHRYLLLENPTPTIKKKKENCKDDKIKQREKEMLK